MRISIMKIRAIIAYIICAFYALWVIAILFFVGQEGNGSVYYLERAFAITFLIGFAVSFAWKGIGGILIVISSILVVVSTIIASGDFLGGLFHLLLTVAGILFIINWRIKRLKAQVAVKEEENK